MSRFTLVVFTCILAIAGCGPSMSFDGGSTPPLDEPVPSDDVQKWWNCFIDSNTTYDNTELENTEILWVTSADTAEEAAKEVLPSITKVIQSFLDAGRIKMEVPGEELHVEVLYCEPN